jgi:hypothetical protein
METNNDLGSGDVASCVEQYRSRLLSDAQSERLLDELKALVLRSEPCSVVQARMALTAACRFLADVAPDEGAVLSELLTESQLILWVNREGLAGGSRRTLSNHVGRIRRLIRVQAELPSVMRTALPATVTPPPLAAMEVQALRAAAVSGGDPALRGLLASVGAGVVGRSAEGAVVTVQGNRAWLALPGGGRRPLVAWCRVLAVGVAGQAVEAEDWQELRLAAASASLVFDPQRAYQTYRYLALTERDPVAVLLRAYRVGYDAVAAIREHLPAVLSPAEVAEVLRGDGRAVPGGAGTSGVSSPVSEVILEARRVASRKVSRAEKQRLREQARQQSEGVTAAVLPPDLELLLAEYRPAGVATERWAAVVDVHREVMRRSSIRGVESFAKNRNIVANYLLWRLDHGNSIQVRDAFTFLEIDRFFMRGLGQHSDRTRNDYRSRLRKIAERVNPGLDAPPRVFTGGHVKVRPGYTAAEEAAIIRTALQQRRPVVRRKLCAVVGFSGGAGLDSSDFRELRREHCRLPEGDGPIVVEVPGANARTTVVRRQYEPLVRVALEGLAPRDVVLGRKLDRHNVTSGIIDDADIFGDVPKPEPARLRSTWLTWLMLRPVPLKVILDASGLRSARTLSDLLSYLPDPVGDVADLLWDGPSA